MKSLGRHVMAELYNCDAKILQDVRSIENVMRAAAESTKAHIIDVVFHKFNPHGVSGVIVIAESHLAIHTWPEYGFASVDIYTCGNEVKPWKAFKFISRRLRAKTSNALEMRRGILNIPAKRLKHKP